MTSPPKKKGGLCRTALPNVELNRSVSVAYVFASAMRLPVLVNRTAQGAMA